VKQRLAHLLLDFVDKFTQDGLSELTLGDQEMAGTNLFSVNKVLRRWQRLGYVQKSRCRIVILDRDNLQRLSSLNSTSKTARINLEG